MIDYWKLTRDFAPGDIVQKFFPAQPGSLSPYHGRVTAVHRGIGFVDVQWPFDNERETPEDLIKLNTEFLGYLPPTLNHSWYPGWDVSKQKQSAWRTTEVPPSFHHELARLHYKGAGEVQAYDELWHRFSGESPDDEAIRDEVLKFYQFGKNARAMYLGQVQRAIQAKIEKEGTYWVATNRQHRANRAELTAGRPNCPRCGSQMRKTTYKMAEGSKMRLFACPQDLYLIRQNDIMGPQGEPVQW